MLPSNAPPYIAKAERALAQPGPVNEITRLVEPAVCTAVLDRLQGETPEIGKERALKAVAVLMAGYPQAALRNRDEGQAFDFNAYTRSIGKTMAKFPEYAVAGMIERKPWGHAFLPSEPEVKEALQSEVTRRAVIIANAKAHKREHRRRQEVAEEERRLEEDRARVSPEERKARCDALVAGLRGALDANQAPPPRPVKSSFDIEADLAALRERLAAAAAHEITEGMQ